MSTRLLATLEAVISEWGETQSSEDDWPQEAYWYDNLAADMATAAFAVFTANTKGQKFAKDEEGE